MGRDAAAAEEGDKAGSRRYLINLICLSEGKYLQLYPPTTCNSPDTMCVWNDGASALTSQAYLPDMCGSTLFNTILLAFDEST